MAGILQSNLTTSKSCLKISSYQKCQIFFYVVSLILFEEYLEIVVESLLLSLIMLENSELKTFSKLLIPIAKRIFTAGRENCPEIFFRLGLNDVVIVRFERTIAAAIAI